MLQLSKFSACYILLFITNFFNMAQLSQVNLSFDQPKPPQIRTPRSGTFAGWYFKLSINIPRYMRDTGSEERRGITGVPHTAAYRLVERDPFVVRRCHRGSLKKGQSERDGRPVSKTSCFADEPITVYVGQLRPHDQWYRKVKFHKKVEFQDDSRNDQT